MNTLARPGLRRIMLVLLLSLIGLSGARAKDIIQITATDITLDRTVTLGFSSLLDAVDRFMGSQPEEFFSGYSSSDAMSLRFLIYNLPFNVSLSEIGMGGEQELTYRFKASDGRLIQRTFTGDSRDDVLDKLKEFFKTNEGQDDYQELMKAIQEANGGGQAAGPSSSVGQQTQVSVQRAMGESMTPEEREVMNAPEATPGTAASGRPEGVEVGIGLEYGMFKDNGLEGESYSIPISFGTYLNRSMKLHIGLPLNVTIVEGAYFYRFGQELALAWTVVGSERGANFKWVVTPSVSNYVTASEDLFMGGDVIGYGIANRIENSWGNLRLSYGTYLGKFESLPVKISDYDVDLNVDETVWANGVKASYGFARRWVGDVYFIDTHSVNGVLENYKTIGAGINYRAGTGRLKNKMFRIGLASDIGQDYDGVRMEMKNPAAERRGINHRAAGI
jgi:hypothetical protein